MSNITELHPLGTLITAIMAILLLFLPRKYSIVPIIFISFVLTENLRVVIAGLDFTMLRIIFVVGWIRVFLRGEMRGLDFNKIDKVIIWMVLVWIITFVIKLGTFSSLINRLGLGFNVISIYFFSRMLIRDGKDVEFAIKLLLGVSVFVAIFMMNEQFSGRNFFSFMGGVPEYSEVRFGQVRSQGPFAHAILAGNFGAALTPLVIGLWWKKVISTKTLLLGFVSASIIVVTAHSSGPMIANLAGMVGIILWMFHDKIRIIFSFGIMMLVALHIVMKAPVWALLMRMGSSGSAYHRVLIIDATVNHFRDWWLIGAESTKDWAHLKTMGDIANYYCRIAVDSGLLGLVLFLTVLFLSFLAAEKVIRKNAENLPFQKFIWSIGSSLFVHTIAFLGISYTGSNIIMLFMTIAVLSSFGTWDENASNVSV